MIVALDPISEIGVPVTPHDQLVLDTAGDVVAVCASPNIAALIASLINMDAFPGVSLGNLMH